MQLIIPKCRDANGQFVVELPGHCDLCDTQQEAVVRYVSWTNDVSIEATVLKRRKHKVGIPCGCYAKLSRQVAHIAGPRGHR